MSASPLTRRSLLATATAGLLPAFAGEPRKVAALISEYRPGSHADAILGKVLQGYYYAGEVRQPRLKLVSMFTDQVPDEDMSRALSVQHGFKQIGRASCRERV